MNFSYPIYLIRIGRSTDHGPVTKNQRPPFFLKAIQSLLASRLDCELTLTDLRFKTMPASIAMARKAIFIVESEQFYLNETSEFFHSTFKLNSESYYFFIGQGPTAIPDDFLNISTESKNLFVIKGEPEEVLLDCIDELFAKGELGDRTRNELQLNDRKTQIAKNFSHFPALIFNKEELDLYQYVFPLKMKERIHWGHILATRGCPHSCSFCTNLIRESYGTNFRTKDISIVMKEIVHLKGLGVNAIAFADDDLTADQVYLDKLCNELIEKNTGIRWTAHARIDECTPELIKKMKLAGCSLLRFGLESGSEKVLRYYNKTRRTDLWKNQINTIIKACHENDIQTAGLFIVGAPNEHLVDVVSTVKMIFSNPFNIIQLHIFTPFQDTIESKKLKIKDVLQDSYYDPNAGDYSGLGRTKTKIIFCSILFFFYLNPLQVFKTLKNYGAYFVYNNNNFMILTKSFLNIFLQSLKFKKNENKSIPSP